MLTTASAIERGREQLRRVGEQREAELHEAVGAHLQQHAGQDHRARGRRLDVRVGQPGVQRHHRHLDREATARRRRAAPSARQRQLGAIQIGEGERGHAGRRLQRVHEVDQRGQHQDAAEGRVQHELERRVDAPLAAPDADDAGTSGSASLPRRRRTGTGPARGRCRSSRTGSAAPSRRTASRPS